MNRPAVYNPVTVRSAMAELNGMSEFIKSVHLPPVEHEVESDMQLVEL